MAEKKKPTFKEIKEFMRNDDKIKLAAMKEFDSSIIVGILIAKGIITQEEYDKAFEALYESYIDQVAQKVFDSMSKDDESGE